MPGGWVPELRLHETGAGCRLTLVGVTYGSGATLQEAADDLVRRVLDVALTMRSRGFGARAGLGAPNTRVLDFLWEVGERAARDHDVRSFILAATQETDPTP
jgi:hypothetical protein